MHHPLINNRYRRLPDCLFTSESPEPAVNASLIELNRPLLREYGLDDDWFVSSEGLKALCGEAHAPNNPPIAMAYAGHQFGQWVPQLGDGRAHMLGQIDTRDGGSVDVQLKGSGRTAYSRGGDGRATLGSVLREHLVSEAMAGLAIPTTRSLAVIGTGRTVMRETPEPGALSVRTATSHLRVGTFQYAAEQGEEALRALAEFVIEEHFPDCAGKPNPYVALLGNVVERQAPLIAQWMLAGFIHGVMNTDNTSIVGETIDFGPCAFIDEFHPRKVFSSIDRMGRYAWNQQASAALWNLTQLAQALGPLFAGVSAKGMSEAHETLDGFATVFEAEFHRRFAAKVGLASEAGVGELIQSTFDLMSTQSLDFTQFFNRLTLAASDTDAPLLDLMSDRSAAQTWIDAWRRQRDRHAAPLADMRAANPVIIARNHRVEQAIAAAYAEDLAPFRRLCAALRRPFDPQDDDADLRRPPEPQERVQRTYCGT